MNKDSTKHRCRLCQKLCTFQATCTGYDLKGCMGPLFLTHLRQTRLPHRWVVSGADAVDCSTNREPAGVSGTSRLVSTVSQQCLSTRFFHSIVLIFPGQGLLSSCDGLVTVGSEHRWITWTNTTAGTPYFPACVGDLLLDPRARYSVP